ncbi:hypothetical protein [Streptomyces sp. NRRL B-24572]|uniref:hypothetical protein n=1 Tax=Streptomyces sp. NRRL B-24572 TaxID=1962156 RepID=UPI000A37C839|nr:hypothetical protein [Streptomyces sp. NRRL B-24572]
MQIVIFCVKKNILLAVLPALALTMAAPAQADVHDGNSEAFAIGGFEAAGNSNHATCACPVPETAAQQLSAASMPGTRFNTQGSGTVSSP